MTNTIKVYLVGGAVRDTLLGRAVTEHDYVVVGATPQQLLDLGFSQVGADFPVFLHPTTHDEYALARTERKSGSGYLGFSVQASPDVTLEDDLIRRDLTINAMAVEVNGLFDSTVKADNFENHLIDPYHGQADLKHKILRHVSPAFADDPVRVLRLVRFASRYAPLGFTIADDTKILVTEMKKAGELNHLVAERVWAETRRAFMQDWGDVYFDALAEIGVLTTILPAFAESVATHLPQWQLSKISLRVAHHLNLDEISCFALLCTVFLKNKDRHLFNEFCRTLKVPKLHSQFANLFLTQFETLQKFNTLDSEKMYDLLRACNTLKQPEILKQLLTCHKVYQLACDKFKLDKIVATLQPIGMNAVDSELRGKEIGEAIERLRLEKLGELMADGVSYENLQA